MKSYELILLLPLAIALIVVSSIGFGSAANGAQVIEIFAKRFEYSPREIRVKQGVPVLLKMQTLDRVHGFQVPDLGIDTTITPGKTTVVRFVPEKTGTFPFHCSVFCGEGHSDMVGEIVVQ